MRVKQPFTCRRSRSAKRWAVAMMIAMTLSPIGRPVFQPTVHAQQQTAPVSQGFNLTAGDLRFIYEQKKGFVSDPQPRVVSNLVLDQTAANPAAFAASQNPCGSGGFVCSPAGEADPVSGALFIPNITPDFGLSAPFNLMFTFFGQFFDHGMDLVNKGGNGNVIMPLKADDPLFVAGSPNNFMVMTRATLQPAPDTILGTAQEIQETVNQTAPWVDQNQTYTSHPSHQVFLRQYVMVLDPVTATLKPVSDGKVL